MHHSEPCLQSSAYLVVKYAVTHAYSAPMYLQACTLTKMQTFGTRRDAHVIAGCCADVHSPLGEYIKDGGKVNLGGQLCTTLEALVAPPARRQPTTAMST